MEKTFEDSGGGGDGNVATSVTGSNLSLNASSNQRNIWSHILANSAFEACLVRVRDFKKDQVEKTFTIYIGLLQVSKLITVDRAPLFSTFER